MATLMPYNKPAQTSVASDESHSLSWACGLTGVQTQPGSAGWSAHAGPRAAWAVLPLVPLILLRPVCWLQSLSSWCWQRHSWQGGHTRSPNVHVWSWHVVLMVLAKTQLARGAHEVPERSRLELARCCLCSIPLAKGRHLVKSKVKGRTLCFILDTPSVHTGVLTE